MKYLLYALIITILTSGCVRRVHHIPLEPPANQNDTHITSTLYDTSSTELKYNLKPEPYSTASKEKDPELLGPQRTIEVPSQTINVAAAKPIEPPTIQSAEAPTPISTSTVSNTMGKDECISMIGATKFERYSKRFGGESGAIKRCAILKKLKRG